MGAELQGRGQHETGAAPGAAAAAERQTASGPEGKHTNKKTQTQANSLSQYEPSPEVQANRTRIKKTPPGLIIYYTDRTVHTFLYLSQGTAMWEGGGNL